MTRYGERPPAYDSDLSIAAIGVAMLPPLRLLAVGNLRGEGSPRQDRVSISGKTGKPAPFPGECSQTGLN
jgi:hypothetical protein